MGGAESPEPREALEELDVVEEVAALVDMAAKRCSTIWKKGAAQGWRRAADQSDLRTAREGRARREGIPARGTRRGEPCVGERLGAPRAGQSGRRGKP